MKRYDYSSGRKLYRSRDGWICGVCQGLSDYFNLRVGWVRFITVLVFLFSGIWPIVIMYLIACLLMKPEPAIPVENEYRQDFCDTHYSRRSRARRDFKRRYSNLERRFRRMEDTVTSRDFEWEQRLERGI